MREAEWIWLEVYSDEVEFTRGYICRGMCIYIYVAN